MESVILLQIVLRVVCSSALCGSLLRACYCNICCLHLCTLIFGERAMTIQGVCPVHAYHKVLFIASHFFPEFGHMLLRFKIIWRLWGWSFLHRLLAQRQSGLTSYQSMVFLPCAFSIFYLSLLYYLTFFSVMKICVFTEQR